MVISSVPVAGTVLAEVVVCGVVAAAVVVVVSAPAKTEGASAGGVGLKRVGGVGCGVVSVLVSVADKTVLLETSIFSLDKSSKGLLLELAAI